ncbi:thermonuclease family protein [Rhizobium sp. BK251]|uniref:thermonuclease family protein n=1 Tax=Rhizobium sp. BK251 TaxID=2512125 RepID=UPI0010524168|nr:thermonuclease family protein [Rhizobium sp. BK251]TCL75040.1 nuclease-like protein [Rhizobium sp. BK251]
MTRFGRLFRDGVTAFALLAFIWLIAQKLQDTPQMVHAGGFVAVDGDTLSRNGERLRLKGIDAPEYSQSCEREGRTWACGLEARLLLEQLILQQNAQCRGDRRDRYDRLLVVCMAGGEDINADMVREGLAVSYGGYRAEEEMARSERAGLWAGAFEMPQDVRHHPEGMYSSRLSDAVDFVRQIAGWH